VSLSDIAGGSNSNVENIFAAFDIQSGRKKTGISAG
jgi:hypothetical protein